MQQQVGAHGWWRAALPAAVICAVGTGCGGSGGSGEMLENLTFFTSIAAAPVDSDDYADLAIGNTFADAKPQRGRLTILLQSRQSPGQFSTRTDLALGDNADCYGVAIGDVDRDGRADVVATSSVARLAGTTPAGHVHIFLQDTAGTGSLRPAGVITTRPHATEVAIADVTGDGRPDLVAGHGAGVDVIAQSGTNPGQFLAAATIAISGGVQTLAVADMNLDGRTDIVTGNPAGVQVLLQTAGGAFSAPVNHAAGFNVSALAVARVDGDAYPDVAAVDAKAKATDPGLALLLSQSANPGTLGLPATYAAGDYPTAVALADLNRDGAVDVAIAESIVGPRDPRLVVLLQEAGQTGRLLAAQTFATRVGVFYELAIADLNGDGLLDVGGAGDGAFYLPQRAGATLAFDAAVRLFNH